MKILLLTLLLFLHVHAKPLADEKKLVLVYIEMEFCPWCHKMNLETLENKEALKELKKEYLIAKIEKESGDVPLFLHPKYYPTSYILSSDGSKVIDELPGYMPKKRFLSYLKFLYELENEPEE